MTLAAQSHNGLNTLDLVGADSSPTAQPSRTLVWTGRISIGTRLLGTVLLSGYFGGAVATHLHMGHPLLSHTLFPLYVAAIFWVGALATIPNLGRLLFGRPKH